MRAQLGPGNLKWISEYIHFDLDEWFLQHLGFEFDHNWIQSDEYIKVNQIII